MKFRVFTLLLGVIATVCGCGIHKVVGGSQATPQPATVAEIPDSAAPLAMPGASIDTPSVVVPAVAAVPDLEDALASSDSQRDTSFNFGYAHKSRNWLRFIDLVAQHETERNVLVSLNQAGEFEYLSGPDFLEQLGNPRARSRRLEQNIGEVKVITEEGMLRLPTTHDANARTLTVVLRARFSPSDMRTLQRCGERLLGTGDNTAIEAWESGCKLFMYEDVANAGCKNFFLRQQVELAGSISASMGRLLELVGAQDEFSSEEQQEMDRLLKDPALGDHTMQFCRTVCREFSLRDNLEGALKRTLWQQLKPELIKFEAASMGRPFHQSIKEFVLRGDREVNIKLSGPDLQAIANRLH